MLSVEGFVCLMSLLLFLIGWIGFYYTPAFYAGVHPWITDHKASEFRGYCNFSYRIIAYYHTNPSKFSPVWGILTFFNGIIFGSLVPLIMTFPNQEYLVILLWVFSFVIYLYIEVRILDVIFKK
jgi:hypothetical protein